MSKYVGRDVAIRFAIASETADPGSLTWLTLGCMRTKTFDCNWDTADVTSDCSPDFTKETLVTFKNFTFSGDGVSDNDDLKNQTALADHACFPGAATNNQPKVWFELSFLGDVKITGPFIVTKWGRSANYADPATWSFEAASNGQFTRTDL